MSLAEKIKRWKNLQSQADALAEEIKAKVMELGKSIEVDNVAAHYSKGHGRYDYKTIVDQLSASEEIINKHPSVHIDWRATVLELGPSGEIPQQFYTPSQPMMFKIIDPKLGHEPVAGELDEIVKNEEWARHLHCDIDLWFITEFGDIGLMDDCGNVGYPPPGRFKIEWTKEQA